MASGESGAHRFLQQLLQTVDVGPVSTLALHHHSVSARHDRAESSGARAAPRANHADGDYEMRQD